MALDTETLVNLTADIAAAHVGKAAVPVSEVGRVITTIFAALKGLGAEPEPAAVKSGAVSARASIKPAHLISMIDGKPYKLLKRHLSTRGYTPESYREMFGLPRDYPMVAADYAAKRREISLASGLGGKPKVAAPTPVTKRRASKARATAAVK